MKEIKTFPSNGLNVISTFSGGGGSCLGYLMAGFRVLWANEFVPAAQNTYRANFPDSILDRRDVRTITAEDILRATNLQAGDLDLFDGSPPCQAFSAAGKREKGWGTSKTYEHGASQKNEELFTEYIRLLRGLQPKVFVAENVSGLIKGTAKGYFKDILKDLKACGYRVACKLLDAQWLGVPQTRQRTIFIGVRADLGIDPVYPQPLPYRYSVREALPHLATSAEIQGGEPEMIIGNEKFGKPTWGTLDHPSPTIMTTAHSVSGEIRTGARIIHDTGGLRSAGDITQKPSPTVRANRAATHFIEIEGANGFNHHAGSAVGQPMSTVQAGRPVHVVDGPLRRKFTIAELKRICAFPDDFILTGSYAQQWERLGNAVPPVMMFHVAKTLKEKIFDPLSF